MVVTNNERNLTSSVAKKKYVVFHHGPKKLMDGPHEAQNISKCTQFEYHLQPHRGHQGTGENIPLS